MYPDIQSKCHVLFQKVWYMAYLTNLISLQKEVMKNALYVKINLYLRGLHPLASTGLMPMFLLVFLNVRISKGIKKLRRPRPFVAQNSDITGLTDLNRRINHGKF